MCLALVTFVAAWTPYAVVAFISSFFSPTLIAPLVGTVPGRFVFVRMILDKGHVCAYPIAIFAKSSIYFNPLVYMVSNSYIRSKLLKRNWPTSSTSGQYRIDMMHHLDLPILALETGSTPDKQESTSHAKLTRFQLVLR